MFPCLKLIEIVIPWVYNTIPPGFNLFFFFCTVQASLCNFVNYFEHFIVVFRCYFNLGHLIAGVYILILLLEQRLQHINVFVSYFTIINTEIVRNEHDFIKKLLTFI